MAFEYTVALLENGLTYQEYRKKIEVELELPTQDKRSAKIQGYIRKNILLMDEYANRYAVNEQLKTALARSIKTSWLVIAEGWCGDAAFNIPLLVKLAAQFPSKIELLFYFRDQNTDLIDDNLTDGGRAIPIVVVVDENLRKVGHWGPRPAELQSKMKTWKAQEMNLKDLLANVQQWYDEDESVTLQNELTAIIKSYNSNHQD